MLAEARQKFAQGGWLFVSLTTLVTWVWSSARKLRAMQTDNLLDHSDLQCPSGHGQMVPAMYESIGIDPRYNVTDGYGCTTCCWFITRIEFTRNAHGTQEQRRARRSAAAPRLAPTASLP